MYKISMADSRKRLTVRVSPDLYKILRMFCAETTTTINEVVETAIIDSLPIRLLNSGIKGRASKFKGTTPTD